MSSCDNKEWFQEFATALVIDGDSDEKPLIHVAEIKHEEVVESEWEIEKLAVAKATLLLNQHDASPTTTKVKILILTYFVDVLSLKQLFNHDRFFNEEVNVVEFDVYNSFRIYLNIRKYCDKIWATVVAPNTSKCQTFVFHEHHLQNVRLPRHVAAFHHQVGNCFYPFLNKLLNGKDPRPKHPVKSTPVM